MLGRSDNTICLLGSDEDRAARACDSRVLAERSLILVVEVTFFAVDIEYRCKIT